MLLIIHTAQVQAAVQQLLMEHGEYVPLVELLLATHGLGYENYRVWREGRLHTLDAVLADGTRESCAWLEAAQARACALGLRRSLQDVYPRLLQRYLAKQTRASAARSLPG